MSEEIHLHLDNLPGGQWKSISTYLLQAAQVPPSTYDTVHAVWAHAHQSWRWGIGLGRKARSAPEYGLACSMSQIQSLLSPGRAERKKSLLKLWRNIAYYQRRDHGLMGWFGRWSQPVSANK